MRVNVWSLTAIATCAVAVIIIFSGISSIDSVASLLFNSDSLLPADLVNDTINHTGSLASFQFPRVPSLFPDLLLYAIITIVIRSWALALVAYACTMLFMIILACSLICRQMTGTSLPRAMTMVLACTTLSLVIATVLDGAANPLLYIMLPVYHSGPFLAALFSLLLARSCLDRPRPISFIALLLMAGLGTVSDPLFVGAFLTPLLGLAAATTITPRGTGKGMSRQGWTILALAMVGCAAGYMIELLLFSHWLLREPDLPIHIGHQLGRIRNIWHDGNVPFEIVCTIINLAVVFARRPHSSHENYWLCIAGFSTIGFLFLVPILWDGPLTTRYFQPIWWWTLIIVSATLSRIGSPFVPGGMLASAAATFIAFTLLKHDSFQIRQVLNRHDPLESCLIQLKQKGIIHDGLADYWVARPTEAASDWRLQIDQITPAGTVFIWGNDIREYLHSRQSPTRSAALDFVVLKNLDERQLVQRFGLPDKVATCPTSNVWVYQDSKRLRWNLGGIATSVDRSGLLDHAACLGPGQFTNQAGPIPPAGIDMPTDTQPRSFATWGPYIGLRKGPWDLQWTYRLKDVSVEPSMWDVSTDDGRDVLGRGMLTSTGGGGGGGSQVTTLNLSMNVPVLEWRTYLSAGDHLQILNLRIKRPWTSGDPCQAGGPSG